MNNQLQLSEEELVGIGFTKNGIVWEFLISDHIGLKLKYGENSNMWYLESKNFGYDLNIQSRMQLFGILMAFRVDLDKNAYAYFCF